MFCTIRLIKKQKELKSVVSAYNERPVLCNLKNHEFAAISVIANASSNVLRPKWMSTFGFV